MTLFDTVLYELCFKETMTLRVDCVLTRHFCYNGRCLGDNIMILCVNYFEEDMTIKC